MIVRVYSVVFVLRREQCDDNVKYIEVIIEKNSEIHNRNA